MSSQQPMKMSHSLAKFMTKSNSSYDVTQDERLLWTVVQTGQTILKEIVISEDRM